MESFLKKILLFSFLTIVFGLIFIFAQKRTIAQECTPGETRSCNDCGTQTCQSDGTWGSCVGSGGRCCTSDGYYKSLSTVCDSQYRTQYKCEPNNQCGNKILKREQKRDRYCPGNSDECTGNWGDWETISSSETQCQAWEKCQNGDWTENQPECKCAGECLETPKNPRYYDNPQYSDRPDKDLGPNGPEGKGLYLPVKLDWDDVQGANSYLIRIERPGGDYSKVTSRSEYNYREDPNAGACFLKSGFTYNWHVKGCCNQDGTNCSQESNFRFKTNFAPELIEPYDPDWNGTSTAENISLPVSLKWCRVKKIKKGGNEYEVSSYNLLPFIIENGERKCHPSRQSDGTCVPFTLAFPPVNTTDSIEYIEYSDEAAGLFTKLSSYAWQVAACGALGAEQICSDYSQGWAFNTGTTTLKEISWFSPPNGSTVGFPVILEWKPPWGANSFQYQVYKDALLVTSGTTTDVKVDITNKLTLDTQYKWRVRVCWDYEAKDCENWPTEWWYFKTTGRPPRPETMKPVGENIPIPVNFEWENVPGAKSYRIKVWGEGLNLEKPTSEAKFSLDYPDLKQEKTYSWQVKTCAKENGEICGDWSETKSFTTFRLSPPSNPSPNNNQEIFTYQMPIGFSWGTVSGARYYKYIINYVQKSPEEVGDCPTGRVMEKIVATNSDLISLNCLGEYQWQVQACLDRDCQEAGNWSVLWNFRVKQEVPQQRRGLVPCGRTYDDPSTPWNEREPCQIKHLFLLLRNILDFLFFRVGMIVLVLLALITGIIYYFSVYSPEILGEWATVLNVRSIWKYAGIGYAIIFFAWLIINLFLALVGYKFQIFGRWWEIGF
jgi:hypothetical protein